MRQRGGLRDISDIPFFPGSSLAWLKFKNTNDEAEAETRAAAAERITVKTLFHKFINSRRFYFVSMPLKRCFQQISYFRIDSFFFFFSLSVSVATTQLLSPYGLHFFFSKKYFERSHYLQLNEGSQEWSQLSSYSASRALWDSKLDRFNKKTLMLMSH